MKAAVVPISIKDNYLTEIKDISKPEIKDDQILIKAKACAINPIDWKHIVYQMSKPGDVAGSDVSGIVEQVGANVTNFKRGFGKFICNGEYVTNEWCICRICCCISSSHY